MFSSGDNRLYLKLDTSANKVIGLIKVGKRKLFVHRETGKISEISPLCVLDFYVHESI
jgi:alpha-tubulin N-acetyltransferase 1